MYEWYWINLPYACYGIKVRNNIIIETAPIAKWAIRKDINYFLDWVGKKGGEYKKL